MINNAMIPQAAPTPVLTQETLLAQADGLMNAALDYKELMLEYTCAIRSVKTKLEILDTEFAVRYSRNPISSIHTRLKSQISIMQKLVRKKLPVTRQSIEENLNDIAGIRVICSYIDDIYRMDKVMATPTQAELIYEKLKRFDTAF